jgi:CubicO group peptidase (beta-lactamase class C family)
MKGDSVMSLIKLGNLENLGFDPGRLSRVKELMNRDIDGQMYDGAALAVARFGELALMETVGWADRENERPLKAEDVFFLMSITKTFTGCAVFQAVEKGLLTLTTNVCEVIPEFGIKGKQRVNVAHLLTHTGGMSPDLPAMLPLEHLGDLQAFVAAVCNDYLRAEPGSKVCYSPTIAHAVLAEMVRRLDGGERTFRQILAEDLFGPLGMNDTALGFPDRLAERKVPVKVRDQTPSLFEPDLIEALNFLLVEDSELPAGGGVSTVGDMIRWAEMLRCGGELEGVRVLSPGIIDMATQNWTGDMPNELFDYTCEINGWEKFPSNLGLSFFLRGPGLHVAPFGLTASPDSFGGLGAGSTMFFVDPERELSVALLTSGLMEEGRSFHRHQKINDLIISAIVD